MDNSFYFERLYPLQDEVLRTLVGVDTGLYLSGGTAVSRGYLHHRFSDDLDLFANDSPQFSLWVDRAASAWAENPHWRTRFVVRDPRFVRLWIDADGDFSLKIEMINDVPSRVGEVRIDSILGRLDSAENILANKITALLDRNEPKDFADIWGLCCQLGLSIGDAIEGASGKAAGVFPLDVASRLCSVTRDDWRLVRWIDPPDPDRFVAELIALGETLLLGS